MTEHRKAARTVFVGNCQAGGLRGAYNQYTAESPEEYARSLAFHELREPQNRELVRSAGNIVVQVADMNSAIVEEIAELNSNIVKFPYISGIFYWPFATESHIYYWQNGFSQFGLFTPELGGDALLNGLLRDGRSAEDAIEIYRSFDFERQGKFSRKLDVILRTQQARDDKSGIETAHYITRNLSHQIMFALRGHPTLGIFVHLATQVFERIGAPPRGIARMERDMFRNPLHFDEVPIHPSLLVQLGHAPDTVERTFNLNGKCQTFDQYVADYMRSHIDHDVQDGLRLYRQGEYEQAIPKLMSQNSHLPLSSTTLFSLSHALAKVGRDTEALDIAEQAAEAAPSEPGALLWLARARMKVGLTDGIEQPLREILARFPDHIDANVLLAIELERQGRFPEALRHVRRARDWGVPAVGVAVRDARLSLMAGNLQAVLAACADASRLGGDSKLIEPILARASAAGLSSR